MHLLPFASGLILAAVARAAVGPGRVTGDTAVHDPTMCKDQNGKYWVFGEYCYKGMLIVANPCDQQPERAFLFVPRPIVSTSNWRELSGQTVHLGLINLLEYQMGMLNHIQLLP
jgi:hypothetical protein